MTDAEAKYLLTRKRMVEFLQRWVQTHPQPTFYLSDEVLLTCIDQVRNVIARDVEARTLVDCLCEIGRAVQPGGEPTLEQLRAVLQLLGIQSRSVPITEFGRLDILTHVRGVS